MKDVYLTQYSVSGIKNIDKFVNLEFYKKTFSKKNTISGYNVKGIYGMNGSGKTGIICSVDILKNLLLDKKYLDNDVVQKNLKELINKKEKKLTIHLQYLYKNLDYDVLFAYTISIEQNEFHSFEITKESLSGKKANSTKDFKDIYIVDKGALTFLDTEDAKCKEIFKSNSINLLSSATLSSIILEKMNIFDSLKENNSLLYIMTLIRFALNLHVFFDRLDDHSQYWIKNIYDSTNVRLSLSKYEGLARDNRNMHRDTLNIIQYSGNTVLKQDFPAFKKDVNRLCEFLKLFKKDLLSISIDKKINNNCYDCQLIMNYEAYDIHVEFESTGIKKLIRLYSYFNEMEKGGIVFIDELDSNLHDVYLCALLDYLMDTAQGQLCFTTHNVSSMNVLNKNKKSIDFLSTDKKIYSWIKNGNYSPSKLYKEGMITGSPFNIESIDFIGIFDNSGED